MGGAGGGGARAPFSPQCLYNCKQRLQLSLIKCNLRGKRTHNNRTNKYYIDRRLYSRISSEMRETYGTKTNVATHGTAKTEWRGSKNGATKKMTCRKERETKSEWESIALSQTKSTIRYLYKACTYHVQWTMAKNKKTTTIFIQNSREKNNKTLAKINKAKDVPEKAKENKKKKYKKQKAQRRKS